MKRFFSVLFLCGLVFSGQAYGMSDTGKQEYLSWLKTISGSDGALAVAPNGCWASGRSHTTNKAKRRALWNCGERCSQDCEIRDINGASQFIKQAGSSGSSTYSSTASSGSTSGSGGESNSSIGKNESNRPAGIFYDVSIDVAHEAVVNSLSANGLSITANDYSTHTIRARKSGYSTGGFLCFGHKITVSLIPYQDGTSVNVVDKLLLPTQVIGCQKVSPMISAHVSNALSVAKRTNRKSETASVDNSLEIEYWKTIKDSNDPEEYQIYLDEYPEGKFVKLAESRLKKLGGNNSAVTNLSTDSGVASNYSSTDVMYWESVKDSDDPDMFQAYIDQFPEGVYVVLAKIKLKNFVNNSSVTQSSIPNLDYGRYHALVIGNDRYRHLKPLSTAVNDVNAVASLLRSRYQFNVDVLTNATRDETVSALSKLRKTISAKDNLLIYYAGHGWLDKEMDEGFWLPVDAVDDDQVDWIANDTIMRSVRAIKAKHVMVVADSCFSGTLIRGIKIRERSPDYIKQIVEKKARTALTSGGLEPVSDVGGGNHSVFAATFMRILNENTGVLDGHQLFTTLRRQVMMNADQTPEYGDIRKAGHDGGDFLFVRQ